MVHRIIQQLLLYATFGAGVLTYEIKLEPSSAVVQEFGSINLTCSHGKQLKVMKFEIINHIYGKTTSTIYLANCSGEGPIVDNVKSYDFYCIDSKSLTVTLKSVQRSGHMDHFTCKRFSLSSNEATIYVKIPVDHIVFQNESNSPVATMEGLKTVFVCITENVYPAPVIMWFANSTVLQNMIHYVSITQEATTNAYPRSYKSVMTMFPKRSDNFTLISCHANNGRRVSGDVRMLVYFPPDTPSIDDVDKKALFATGHVRIIAGNALVIVCSSQSYPKPHYQWTIENKVIAVGNILDISIGSHSNYTRTLTCMVNNSMPLYNGNRYGSNETSVALEILFPPEHIRIQINGQTVLENTTSEVVEGTTVTILCSATSVPPPSAFKLVGEQNFDEVTTNTGEFQIKNVTRYQAGKYMLTVINQMIPSFKRQVAGKSNMSFNINVLCSPRPNQDISLQSYFASALFVQKTINFEIYAFPEPGMDGFTWNKWENATSWINLHNDDSTSISTWGLQSNLTLTNITQQSFGIYRLNVTNNAGSFTHEFMLSPNDKPRPPTLFHIIEALTTDTSVCVSWRPGFNGGLPQTFILDYRKLESNNDWSPILIFDSEENVMNTTVLSLTSETVYEFKIMSTNEKGNSSAVGPVTMKTKELEDVNPSTGRRFVSAMAGGIISILAIVAVFVGVVVYQRRNIKKKAGTSDGATVENRNTSGNVLPNERATSSTLEEFEDTGIYENVLFTTSPTSTSNVSSSKKLFENVLGTKLTTSQIKNKKKKIKGRKSTYRVTYLRDCPEEEHSVDRVETNRQPEPDTVMQNDGKHETRIPVSSLFSYVTNSSYHSEFSLLPKGMQYAATVARKPENCQLNRYNALFPYDQSRVVLLNDPTFYMNACYIDGYRKRKAYIASLGPTAETTNNYIAFWKMVWYENSDIIVMLTCLIKISGMTCQQYWPELDKMEHYGEVAVYCRHVEVFAEYTIRTFDVSKNNVVRQLHQLHFTAWPDNSVPDDMSSLLEFRQRLQTTFTTGRGPIVIHCSAGVGSTGTLIAINNLIDEGNREGNVDVLACVKRLREQRVNLVNTEQQYCFIYKTLVYALEYETDSITAEMFQKYLESKDDSFFESMFDRLQMNIESEFDAEALLINQNRTMLNRSGADIPGNKNRVRVYPDKRADLDSINAVYLNSFKKERYFIAARTPTHVTIEDFIRMLFQENCICIISLGESETHGNVYQNKDTGLYLPPDNQTLTVGNFTVSCTRLKTNPHYIVRRMKVKHNTKINNEEKVSYHFQYTGWDVDKVFPNDPSEFAHFIIHVDQFIANHTECSGHVLVHCLDASERCGLFCSIATMIEKMECEHRVNIGNTIRQIRSRRSTVIQNMKQLRFCHEAVNAYINMFRC